MIPNYMYDSKAFNTFKYDWVGGIEEAYSIIVDSLAVLYGDYEIYRKQCAILLLKIFLKKEFYDHALNDNNLYPFDRNDRRVRKWTNKVLSKGSCELCGSKEHLEAHHIIKWADYPQGRIDIKNGQCLCHDCHTKEHILDRSYSMMKARYENKQK